MFARLRIVFLSRHDDAGAWKESEIADVVVVRVVSHDVVSRRRVDAELGEKFGSRRRRRALAEPRPDRGETSVDDRWCGPHRAGSREVIHLDRRVSSW